MNYKDKKYLYICSILRAKGTNMLHQCTFKIFSNCFNFNEGILAREFSRYKVIKQFIFLKRKGKKMVEIFKVFYTLIIFASLYLVVASVQSKHILYFLVYLIINLSPPFL